MGIRDLRDRARASLHERLADPAVYVPPSGAPVPCSIRVHDRTRNFGDMTGFALPAERIETVPEIVCLASEVAPIRGGIFSIAADEAYRVEIALPRDGITVKVQVTRLTQAQIDAGSYPLPEV